MSPEESEPNSDQIEHIRGELAKTYSSNWQRALEKFTSAALGSIPWVGGFLSAAADLKFQEKDARENDLQTRWLEEHTMKLARLSESIKSVKSRFESLGEQIEERIKSEEYLDLVRRAYRAWDRADTDEKRKFVGNLVSNAGGTKLTSDDVIRLFIDWLDTYHESHFAVIKEIYQKTGSTRYDIWESINGTFPREDSAEADLFRMLIRDLSTGGVIRQERATTVDGQFLRKPRTTHRGIASTTMDSSFDDTKPYVLTELGKQFVHYAMTEIVPRIGSSTSPTDGQSA
jgi:hypothetical protein